MGCDGHQGKPRNEVSRYQLRLGRQRPCSAIAAWATAGLLIYFSTSFIFNTTMNQFSFQLRRALLIPVVATVFFALGCSEEANTVIEQPESAAQAMDDYEEMQNEMADKPYGE